MEPGIRAEEHEIPSPRQRRQARTLTLVKPLAWAPPNDTTVVQTTELKDGEKAEIDFVEHTTGPNRACSPTSCAFRDCRQQVKEMSDLGMEMSGPSSELEELRRSQSLTI
jgi:hypothetical protein